MSKTTLAIQLADELGVSVSKALRFIDDVGYSRASRLVDEGARAGDEAGGLMARLPDDWWKPTAAIGGVATGGLVGYRYLSLQQAEALADGAQADSDRATTAENAVRTILDRDDLTPQQKRELIDRVLGVMESRTPGDDTPGGGLFGGDTQTLIVLLIVLALVFNYAMEDD